MIEKLSIVIPVYNEEKTVESVIKAVDAIRLKVKKEIIVVNDGSTDKTVTIVKNLSKRIKLTFINLHRNSGKGVAVSEGIKKAKGDYVVIQDADLEYDPRFLSNLVEPVISNKAEVVYGSRLMRLPHLKGEENRFRFLLHYFGNRFLSLVTSIFFGQWITDMETCYKLFPKSILIGEKLTARGFELEPELTAIIMKKGVKIFEVPIKTKPRGYEAGKKLQTFKDGKKAMKMLLKKRLEYDSKK